MKRFFLFACFIFLGSFSVIAQTADLAGSYYHFSLAKIHESQRQYKQAILEFEKAVGLNQQSAQLRVQFAESLWRSGEIRRAVEECQKAIELDSDNSTPHFLLGQIYSTFRASEQTDMVRKAIEELNRTLELDPEHFQAMYELGRLQLARSNYRSAVTLFGRFLELRPWIVQGYWMKSRAHVELDEIEEAIKTLELSLNYEDDNLENLKMLSKLYEQTARLDQAKELYRQVLKVGEDPDIQFRLALMLSEERSFKEAVLILQKLAKNFPKNVQIKIALGRAQKGQKHYSDAVEVFRGVLFLEPNHFQANFELAESLASLGEREEALKKFGELLQVAQSELDRTSIQINLAFIYQDFQEFDKAVEILREIVEESPENDLASLRLVYALEDAGELQEALDLSYRLFSKYEDRSYEKAPRKSYFVVARAQMLSASDDLQKAIDLLSGEIGDHPETETLYLAGSQLYLDHEKYQEAEHFIRKAMSPDADSAKLQFQLGAIYERQGEVEKAETAFGKVLETNPQHAGVLNYLGYMLADRGLRLQEALSYIEEAVEIEPHNGAFLDSLGWVYFKLDQLEKAQINLAAAIRINDHDSTIYEHFGDLYFKLMDYDRARDYYRRSLQFASKKEQEKVEKKLVAVSQRLSKNAR